VEDFLTAQRLPATDIDAILSGNAIRANPRLRVPGSASSAARQSRAASSSTES
jgi:hypothetical protein